MKVLTVLGTRPEIIRLSEIIKRLDQTFEHVLVHTGQNYDHTLNQIFFDDLNLRHPDYILDTAEDSAVKTIGNIMSKVDEVLEAEKPDALLVLGDTNSCLAAYSAKRKHIPVFHAEAGNRCFDARVPEELNRKIIDHISDVNLTYSHAALNNLVREGLHTDRCFVVGSPLYEVFASHRDKIESSKIVKDLGLDKDKYFLVSLHREENVDSLENLKKLFSTLTLVGREYGLPVLVSAHPRTQKKLHDYKIKISDNVHLHNPFGFVSYNALQINAKCVLSDSGSINEEAAILGFKAVNVRNAHERPEASVTAVTPMSGLNSDNLLNCVDFVLNKEVVAEIPDGYNISDVSWRVANHIFSLTEYVKLQNRW